MQYGNTVGLAFSKVGRLLWDATERTVEALWQAVVRLLEETASY